MKQTSKSNFPVLMGAVIALAMTMTGCANQAQPALEEQVSGLRTAMGELRATLGSLSTVQAYQSTQIGMAQEEQEDLAPASTTAAPQPVDITLTSSPTAHTPVYGSVEIEEGICCAGGQAGETIQLSVAFNAASTQGEVVEMRYVTAFVRADEERIAEQAWVPYQADLSFTTRIAVNWVGWWISVQYRDDQGTISPIYYDDISLEGH